jgi:hypothetical protein
MNAKAAPSRSSGRPRDREAIEDRSGYDDILRRRALGALNDVELDARALG